MQPIPESVEEELTKSILEIPLSDIDLSITLRLNKKL